MVEVMKANQVLILLSLGLKLAVTLAQVGRLATDLMFLLGL